MTEAQLDDLASAVVALICGGVALLSIGTLFLLGISHAFPAPGEWASRLLGLSGWIVGAGCLTTARKLLR